MPRGTRPTTSPPHPLSRPLVAKLNIMQTSQVRASGRAYLTTTAATATAGTTATAWVIDGDISTGHRFADISAYVRRVSDTLARAVGKAPDIDPQSLVDLAHQVPGSPGMAASIAVVRKTPIAAEYAVLGMCAVVARTRAKELEVVQDCRWAEVTRNQRAHLVTAMSMNVDTRPARARLAEATRGRRNTPGGYWCIEPGRADAAAHMIFGSIRTNRPVVVSSPGALRAGVDGLYRRSVRRRADVATGWAWRHSSGMQDCTIALLD